MSTDKRTLAAIIREGVANIEKFGWFKGGFGGENCGVCAAGSLPGMFEGDEAIVPNPNSWLMIDAENAWEALDVHIAERFPGRFECIHQFNDHRSVTKSDVLAEMLICAEKLETGEA